MARNASRTEHDGGSTRKRVMIVDGHSIIFACEDLRTMHTRNSGSARDTLASRLARFQDASDFKVVLVFDGRGVRVSQEKMPEGIQTFYSKTGQTADEVVERLVANYADVHEITVATNDNLERQTVISFGAFCIDADQLLQRMEDSERLLQREIQQINRRNRRNRRR